MIRKLIALLFLGCAAFAQGLTHRYEVVDLGVLPGQPDSRAQGINASGTVVGRSGTRPFVYSNCRMYDLGLLPGGSAALATAINNNGVIAGQAVGSDMGTHAVSWSSNAIHLLQPGTTYQSQGLAINAPGEVVGYEYNGLVGYATGYQNGQPVVVPSDNDPTYGWGSVEIVTGINSSGQMTGYRLIKNSLNQAVAQIAVVIPSGSNSWVRVTPPFGFDQYVYAQAINEDGAVVGSGQNAQAISRAFLSTSASASALNLGTLGGSSSYAFALNNTRWVVGSADSASTTSAFLYDGTSMIDLNDTLVNGVGWHLSVATAINDYNQIAGVGIHNGQSRAFLLLPASSAVFGEILPCLGSVFAPLLR